MIWNDEFDVPGAPNPEYWSHEVNCSGGGNNEWQCYTDRLDNSYVDEDGFLHIVAKEEFYSGPSLWDDDPDYPGPYVYRNYTSARLRTRNKVDWKYGRIEVRAQVPGGQGMWPAIWMLPTDWEYGGWPSSGEIDIIEAVNLARDNFYRVGQLRPRDPALRPAVATVGEPRPVLLHGRQPGGRLPRVRPRVG